MPWPGLSAFPARFLRIPARQPTAAITSPPLCPNLSAAWTATSVTMFAKKQLGFVEFPAQSPVGRTTLVNVRPASVERKSPNPVAA